MRFNPTTWINTPFRKLLLFIASLLVLSSAGFYALELRPRNVDFLSAIWWTVVTLTTVGYGDLVPATTPGRVLGIFVMVCGIGMVSTLTGNLASIIVEKRAKRRKGLLTVKLSGHIVIVGWNTFAKNLVATLKDGGVLSKTSLVLINSLTPEERDSLAFDLDMGDALHFVYGNPAHESVAHRASPSSARLIYILSQTGVSAADADQQSLYAALTIRSLAPKTPIYSEVVLAENRDHLLRAGVNEIVPRGEVACMLLGRMGKTPSVWPFFQSLVGSRNTPGLLDYRRLTADEKQLDWAALVRRARSGEGALPLALCHESKDLTLKDMLDEGSALDQFVLELFTMAGQQTSLGHQGTSIVVNPPDDQSLEGFDGLLFLKTQGAGAA
ncbi:potassium channel family protein [Desulfocurvus sp. DL9XJH121]